MQQLEALVFVLLLLHAHALPWSMVTEVEDKDCLETESSLPAQESSPSWPTPVATPTAELFTTSTPIATPKSTASGNQTVTPPDCLDDTDTEINSATNTITMTITYTPSSKPSISPPTAMPSSSNISSNSAAFYSPQTASPLTPTIPTILPRDLLTPITPILAAITPAAIICSEGSNSLMSVNNDPASWCFCGGQGPFSTLSQATTSYCAFTTLPTQTISLTSHSTPADSACRVTS
jgi:hypothetical protein